MADYPLQYQLFNTYQSKNLNIVVEIDGVGVFFSSSDLYTRIRYGDPDINYGDPGLVYGGLRKLTNLDGSPAYQSYLSLDASSLTLNQRLEPEQGRASVSMLTLGFIDKDGYMSKVISPGIIVDEILGRNVTVKLGYIQTSFPEDYYTVFRAIVSQATSNAGLVTLQLSDSNAKRRQDLFYTATTTLFGDIDAVTTTIPVAANQDFHLPILGPNGSYDPSVVCYLQIENEWIQYDALGFGLNQFTNVIRGARGSVAAAHTDTTTVTCAITLQGHAIDLALKLMLSGWGGNWIDGVALYGLAQTTDPILMNQPNAIILPNNIDADQNYGLVTGDYITISGAANPSNNKTCKVLDFGDLFGEPNRIIYTDTTFISETPTTGTMAIRSQYDTLPDTCGLMMEPFVIDIARHLEIKNLFLIGSENDYRFFITSQQTGKDFLEGEIYLPVACYSLTRFGRMSLGITKPPIADERLQYLTQDNITDPEKIAPNRSINNRKFYNEIQFYWDVDDSGAPTSAIKFLDSDSLTLIGISSVLPITSMGARTDLGSNTLFERRAEFLLTRYKRGAVSFKVTVNWEVGSQIEAGDVVALVDNGNLHITNFSTGERNIGTQLFEVTERVLDLKSGNCNLLLVAGVGAEATDRYGTISPSSNLDVGSTTSTLTIMDSYGALYPGNESRKWKDYGGQNIIVHSFDWSFLEETTLLGISPTNRYQLLIDPPLSIPPPSGYIVDIPPYVTSPNPLDAQIYKVIHAFQTPQVTATHGFSVSAFSVASGDINKFFANGFVRVHDYAYTYDSGDVQISAVDVTANTIYTKTSLGFVVPASGSLIDLIGFSFDKGGPYRLI